MWFCSRSRLLKDNKVKPDVFIGAIRCSENLDELYATRYESLIFCLFNRTTYKFTTCSIVTR